MSIAMGSSRVTETTNNVTSAIGTGKSKVGTSQQMMLFIGRPMLCLAKARRGMSRGFETSVGKFEVKWPVTGLKKAWGFPGRGGKAPLCRIDIWRISTVLRCTASTQHC